ncbi:MAG: DUF4783 domain-containing protein [Flavobacteriales bacterium]|nr:DUF4783 domain-containing protein [Flavobacteriales bacterium]
MKKLFFIFLVSLSLFSFALPLSTSIVNALKTGNSGELAKFMEASIDLSIPGNEGAFSKTQSELILKNFFEKNTPSAFKIMHNGDAKNNTHYTIGNLTTTTGVYRVYILYKDSSTLNTILELRIEKDE